MGRHLLRALGTGPSLPHGPKIRGLSGRQRQHAVLTARNAGRRRRPLSRPICTRTRSPLVPPFPQLLVAAGVRARLQEVLRGAPLPGWRFRGPGSAHSPCKASTAVRRRRPRPPMRSPSAEDLEVPTCCQLVQVVASDVGVERKTHCHLRGGHSRGRVAHVQVDLPPGRVPERGSNRGDHSRELAPAERLLGAPGISRAYVGLYGHSLLCELHHCETSYLRLAPLGPK